jgi:hypothetical protein
VDIPRKRKLCVAREIVEQNFANRMMNMTDSPPPTPATSPNSLSPSMSPAPCTFLTPATSPTEASHTYTSPPTTDSSQTTPPPKRQKNCTLSQDEDFMQQLTTQLATDQPFSNQLFFEQPSTGQSCASQPFITGNSLSLPSNCTLPELRNYAPTSPLNCDVECLLNLSFTEGELEEFIISQIV